MARRKIDVTLSKIRLLVSEITQQENLGRALHDQYIAQQHRILQASLYGEVDLSTVLGLLADLDQKLTEIDRTGRQRALVRQRAERELRSLTLTRQVEDAKSELAVLQQRRGEIDADLASFDAASEADPDRTAALQAEARRLAVEMSQLMSQLREIITEASDQAARTFDRPARPLPPTTEPGR